MYGEIVQGTTSLYYLGTFGRPVMQDLAPIICLSIDTASGF